MPSHPLDRDTRLSVALAAIISRNRYTDDPAAVVRELRETAGDRTDILAEEIGQWIGFYGEDPILAEHVAPLTAALRQMTDLDLEPHIIVGRRRRSAPHNTSMKSTRQG